MIFLSMDAVIQQKKLTRITKQICELLFERCREFNCKLNKSKVSLCKTSVKLYGFTAIGNMQTPKCRDDVARFLGMVNYLARFIPNFSTESQNLRKLVHKDLSWKWTSMEENELKSRKQLQIFRH